MGKTRFQNSEVYAKGLGVIDSDGNENMVVGPDGTLYNHSSVLFTEAGAGTYTGSVSIPAGSLIVDIIIHAIALWTSTSAAMIVGDAADDNGFFDAVNLKATDLDVAESINFSHTGGKEGADVDSPASGAHVRRRYLATARVVTGKVTASGGTGTAGRTLMTVVYTTPSAVAATKS